ncbi:MAG: lamin tail domain-containing protein, partial [Bacteroidales bacterium]|nr:lamin tail domain-containing protein [Bacteroidales bacterium]
MKKKFLFLFGFLFVFSSMFSQGLFISEVSDPGDNANARFVELYNPTSTDIDLSVGTFYFCRQANGATLNSVALTGTVLANSTFVIATNATNFLAAYGFDADFISGYVSGNGDDGYYLFVGGDHTTGTMYDAYGVMNEDGTGMAWEYLDGYAVRNSDIDNPNTTWTSSEWAISSGGVADMTPGTHTVGTVTVPVISNIAILPTAPTSSDAVVVSATITDDVAVTGANLYWSLTSPVTTSDNATAMTNVVDVYSATIPAQADGATVYYMIDATDGSATTTSNEMSYTVTDPVGVVDVATIAELRLGATDGTEYRLTGEAFITYQRASRNQKYIQDATGGILIDDNAGTITTTYN